MPKPLIVKVLSSPQLVFTPSGHPAHYLSTQVVIGAGELKDGQLVAVALSDNTPMEVPQVGQEVEPTIREHGEGPIKEIRLWWP